MATDGDAPDGAESADIAKTGDESFGKVVVGITIIMRGSGRGGDGGGRPPTYVKLLDVPSCKAGVNSLARFRSSTGFVVFTLAQ